MQGRFSIEIGARSTGVNDFLLGVSTSAESSDGGFSSDTTGTNLTVKPGVLMPPGPVTDASTNLTEELIASTEDPGYLGDDRVMVGDEKGLYTFDSGALTKEATAAPTGDITLGTSDMVSWFDDNDNLVYYYITTAAGANGDIVRWNGGATVVNDYWTSASHLNQSALSAYTPYRPLLVYEKNLYIGDANRLHRVEPDETVTAGILSLTGANDSSVEPPEVISALGIDNSSGYMLIATSFSNDYSAARNGRSRLYYYDGFSNKTLKVINTHGTITAIVSVGDATHVFYGNKMGLFTGSGIKHLRTFRFNVGDSTDLIYKHKVTVIDDTIYIAEQNKLGSAIYPTTIMAYGPVQQGGQNIFYPVLSPDTTNKEISLLCPVDGAKLGFSYATDKFFTYDTTSTASVIIGGAFFQSNWYRFPRPVELRNVIIELESQLDTGTEAIMTIQIEDENRDTTTIQTFLQDTNNRAVLISPTIGMKVTAFRLKHINAPETPADIHGVNRFVVFYDYVE